MSIATRNAKGGKYLVRRAVERSTRIRHCHCHSKPLPAISEAEDSAREDNNA